MPSASARFGWAVLLPLLAACPPAAFGQAVSERAAIGCREGDRRLDEERFVRIGDIDQWVTVRGDSCANPVILFLHGGPGNPLSPYAAGIYAAWERDFTLVQWDQRGAGRTFGRQTHPADLTIERMAATRELAPQLTAHQRYSFEFSTVPPAGLPYAVYDQMERELVACIDVGTFGFHESWTCWRARN